MGKSSPSPPATPDYTGAAIAQGNANIDAARTGAQLNRVNQYTPWGSQVYTQNPAGGPDSWEQTMTLAPAQQKLLDNQNQGEIALGNTAIQGIGNVQNTFNQPFNPNLPDRVNSVAGSTPSYSMYNGSTNAPVSNIDFSNLGNVPTSGDYGAQKQQVTDALYGQATAKLDPQYAQADDALRTRLLNSGVTEGSTAYNNAMQQFGQQKAADYGDARDRAILAGGQEQSRLTSDALAGRNQLMNQDVTGSQFANTAQGQSMQQALAALGFNNTSKSQTLADAITSGNFQNQQRGASLDEANFMRDQPLNEFNALMSGGQVSNPGFGGVPGSVSPAAAPIFAGTQAAGQSAIDLYNQQAAGTNSQNASTAGLAGTLGMAAMMF